MPTRETVLYRMLSYNRKAVGDFPCSNRQYHEPKKSLSAASAGPLDKKTIAVRAVCEHLCKIRPFAGASVNIKTVSNEGP